MFSFSSLLFYTAMIKFRSQHIIRVGLDGIDARIIFTYDISNDVNSIRPLLTIDRISHHLYFYTGIDKIFVLNTNGDVLHVQHHIEHHCHALHVYAGIVIFLMNHVNMFHLLDKLYQTFVDIINTTSSEFRIHGKYALGTVRFEYDVDRTVRSHDSSLFDRLPTNTNESMAYQLTNYWPLYQFDDQRYSMHMIDFLLVDIEQTQRAFLVLSSNINNLMTCLYLALIEHRCDQCEQLCLVSSHDQTDIVCQCAQDARLNDDGHTCQWHCPK
jgi:hypothetical protein